MIRNSNRSGFIVARPAGKKKTAGGTDVRSGKVGSGKVTEAKTKAVVRRERIVARKDGLEVVEVR